MAFAHLHTHTAYSLLDGEGTIKKILDRAKEQGQTAMAITDHGCMFGVIDFYEYAKSIGIKPVLGCEVYVAARTRNDKVHELDSRSSHLILLAKNNQGYKNLMNIVSIGYVEGFYYKPRIDMEVLRENSEGIIALSACMLGVLSKKILNGDYDGAKESAQEFVDVFGKENYFIEIQDHGIFEQKMLNRELVRLARELDLGIVATNDIHYARREDAEYQDILMCIQMGKTVNSEDRMKMSTAEMFVKSEAEMRELFDYIPEALENTQRIADMCDVEIEFGKLHLPKFDLPEGYTSPEYLRELCRQGFERRYPNADSALHDRLEYELKTIESMGYVDYFLIVWDFIHFARENGIMVGPGRGSAAGSIVSYCLEITNIDPIKYELIFERFLNPERVTMPDIDIDFCYERRGEVIDYVNRKYGSDKVAQIVTFGTMAAKLAIRDTGRALDMPLSFVDSVAKQIPNELNMTIERALDENKQLKGMYDADPQVKRLIDVSSEFEGLPRHTSTHAAGVVITREPVQTYVPLSRNDDVITTQFTMTTIERLGLLKMDFLGLRTLTVIRDAVNNIKLMHGIEINMDEVDMSDKDTFEMISRGETDGVFQLESGGMKEFMKELKPNSIEDIIAGISLYRPGPMDSIPQYIANKNCGNIKYKHPLLEPILNVTYGCIVYQEQVMQIVRELGGYSLGRADLVRRAMSKKKTDVMEQERKNFVYGVKDENGVVEVEGAISRGIDEKIAVSIFDEMMDFAKYAFNKSHAAAYAFVSYQTAWLKCHYPTEFYAALLTSVLGNSTKITKHINEAKKLGIKMLPPDVNKSYTSFVPDGKDIRFGLAAIKNVGSAFINDMANERTENGEFVSFRDFCGRMADKKLNKRLVESLIKGGAFDSLKINRSVLLSVYESVIESAVREQKNSVEGQLDFFGMFDDESSVIEDDFPELPELPRKELLNAEKEYMGVYVSGHPLDGLETVINNNSSTSVLEISENEGNKFETDSKVKIAGMISKRKEQLTKRGDLMLYVTFEDLTGDIEVLVFPSQVKRFDSLLKEESFCILQGNLDIQEDKPPKIRLENVEILETSAPDFKKLYLKLSSLDKSKLEAVKTILSGNNGSVPVLIYYEDKKETLQAPKSWWLKNDKCIAALENILGSDSVKKVN
ncbi:MAG: DNA polymerase III subunit alpha [Clostridia bacterium]|nr:DNA polymerase III subunit alpha [Clostridia bacterium]